MAMKFTVDQQKVIDTRNKNILVSAAAGSGKTAVLVERIIQMITDDKNPVDIDRLLIVTFTSAAAAQMRERISKAVAKKLEENPENEHLQKQASLIHNAQITTIDSFCLFIIRNNFNEIGLDPGFRVADEGEIKMIENDVLDKVLEDAHANADEGFLRFVESYSTGASEGKIEEAILRLYHFSISNPFPDEWLQQRMDDYVIDDISNLSQKEWFRGALKYMDTVLLECEERLHRALEIANGVAGPFQYVDNLNADLELIEAFRSTKDYAKLYDLFTYSSFSRLSAKKGEGVDPLLKDMVKAIRDEVKKNIAELKKFLFQISPDDTFDDMQVCSEVVGELVKLTLEFKHRLDQAKRDKNVIDFSDMEHFALEILLEKDEEGNIVPRNTALELQDYFTEIMIDEYQDSNEVQELLLKSISGEKSGRYNRFMVGDVKQSIYKFRLARPEIFMEKYDNYVADGNDDNNKVRIDLSMNFRSRREVTDATNYICAQIMKKQVGNVEYDQKAALYVGASYPESEDMAQYHTELLIATEPSEEEMQVTNQSYQADEKYSEKEKEAIMVARRIKQLVGKMPVTDGSTGEVRPAKFSDIVILFRATSGWDEDFRRVLSEHGIPVHVTSKTGYFQTLEIQGIVNILRVLDNPLQDIPLFGVMRLPYFDFLDEDIAAIKCFSKEYQRSKVESEDIVIEKPLLYEQLKMCMKATEEQSELMTLDTVLIAKIEHFMEKLSLYRKKVAYTPIKDLIWEIINDTGYASYVGAMPGGDQRQANLELLLEKAGAFQKTSFYGLFHFIRYLENIQEQEVDFGEANILDENANVVRIMTIHKSKGLEFPICFVCGLSKQFNLMDVRQSIIMDVELGVGIDYIDPDMRIKRKTLRKNVVAQRMKEDTRGEDLRVLYVALTRAKEKLIMTGYVPDITKKLSSNLFMTMESAQKLPYSAIMGANSYMDLIFSSLIRHECMKNLLEDRGFEYIRQNLEFSDIPMNVQLVKRYTDEVEEFVSEQKAYSLEENLENASKYADKELAAYFEERVNYVYPHEYLKGLTVKTTVSELKKEAYQENVDESKMLVELPKESYIPRFVELSSNEESELQEISDGESAIENTEYKRAILGTQYGTAVHKVMELLSFSEQLLYDENADFDSIYDTIQKEREQWISDGTVTKESIACVTNKKIIKFLKSDIAKRMIKSNQEQKLFKEQPFVLGVEANKLDSKYPADETMLVQGVIDAFFYEDDEIVLIDYKTDRVEEGKELADRYKTQLEYYQMALEQITGCKVKEKYLYSFRLQELVIVD